MFRRLVYKVLAALVLLTTAAHADSIVTGSKPFTFIPGTVISSSAVNADFDYIINQVNTNAAKNGVNSSITALVGLTTPISPSQGGSPIYTSGTAGGTVDVLTISSTVPAISSYSLSNSNFVSFIAAGANTVNAPTLNVNATGAKVLQKVSSGGKVDLRPGELVAGNAYLVYYDGVSYVVINMPRLYGTATSLTSASTTDLGTIGSHNITLTGVATINAFGSTANVGEPLYFIKYTGAGLAVVNSASIITSSGANIFLNTNDTLLAEYVGSGNWRIQQYIPAGTNGGSSGGIGAANGLVIRNNSGTPNTQIDISIGSVTLQTTGGGASSFFINGTLTANGAVTGANGLDTGALANNTWYFVYIISNGSSSASLLSTNSFAPTMPSGYVYKYRVGAVKTGGAATFLRTIQRGNRAQYEVIAASTTPNLPQLGSGISGSPTVPTWTSVGVSAGTVPATATRIQGFMASQSSGQRFMCAPSNAYGAYNSATNPPPVGVISGNTQPALTIPFEFALESTNIFWASDAAAVQLVVMGWTDNVNAN